MGNSILLSISILPRSPISLSQLLPTSTEQERMSWCIIIILVKVRPLETFLVDDYVNIYIYVYDI